MREVVDLYDEFRVVMGRGDNYVNVGIKLWIFVLNNLKWKVIRNFFIIR